MKPISLFILAIAALSQASPAANPASTTPLRPIDSPPAIPPPLSDMHVARLRQNTTLERMIPECAFVCFENYIMRYAKCQLNENLCICNSAKVQNKEITVCLVNSCGFSKASNFVYPQVRRFCADVLQNQPLSKHD